VLIIICFNARVTQYHLMHSLILNPDYALELCDEP